MCHAAGETKSISAEKLSFEEFSVDGLVLYQLATAPRFGDLFFKEVTLAVRDGFTQPDINSGHIRSGG